jgi:inositol transport system substrate-binding protein
MKSFRTILAAAALAAALPSGCSRQAPGGRDGKPVIGVSLLSLSSEYIVQLNKVLETRAAELGATLVVNDAQRSAERQVQQVENFVSQKVDAIILNPCEVEASSPAVDRAAAAGIPLVNVNSETRSAPTAFVGSHDEEAGRLAMEYIAKRLNGSGSLVMIHGYMGQAAQIKRDRGAREVLAKYPGMKVLAEQTAEWDRAKARTGFNLTAAASTRCFRTTTKWRWARSSRWNKPAGTRA